MTPAEKVLALATGVRQTGPGRWMFKSPNREERTASISMRELPDGRVLLHDFGDSEAGAASIMDGLGLDIGDLYPAALCAPVRAHHTRPQRRSLINAGDAIRLLRRELCLIVIAGLNLGHGAAFTDEDRSRLLTAARRIDAVLEDIA